ncbi:Wac-like whisker protein [Klebsiella phage Metamorpho]|nr:Wac-like whisker protein [Klebsiella phage Metamorpho]
MAKNLVLEPIPFVDGIPDEFQSRINWIKNTEPLNGASTRFGNDGELNRAGTQIQQNIETLDKNINSIVSTVEDTSDEVEQIKKSLEIIGDTSAIEQVYKNKDNIEKHETRITALEDSGEEGLIKLNDLYADVGVYDAVTDPYYRTVRDNLVWIKKEMGAYPGQNMNGESVSDAPGSGMKYRIITNGTAIAAHAIRIKSLEDAYLDSDVGSLNEEVKALRKEVGPAASATSANIYARLTSNADNITRANQDIRNVEFAIDYTNPVKIGTRVSNLEDSYRIIDASINSSTSGLNKRVTDIEVKIGDKSKPASIEGRLNALSTEQKYMSDVLGRDTSSGLQWQVVQINQNIGIVQDGQPVPDGSILNRLDDVEGLQNSQQSSIQEIQAEIGNNNEGLKGSIFGLQTQMNGDGVSENDPVARDGVYLTVVDLHDKFVTAVTDVKEEGTYLRQKDSWVKKSVALGVFSKEDAPVDMSAGDYAFPSYELTVNPITNKIRLVDDIVIDDSGDFCIETDFVIDAVDSDKHIAVVLMVNDIETKIYPYGVKTVSGEQLIKTKSIHRFTASDKVRFVIRPMNDAAKVQTTIKHVEVTIHPAV